MEPIVSRHTIANLAQEAARQRAAGLTTVNPYPEGSDAHAFFNSTVERYMAETVEGAEASA